MPKLLLWALVFGLAAPLAAAKDDPDAMMWKARDLARKGSLIEAAQLYVAAFRAAQKEKDLGAQQRITRSMQLSMFRGSMEAADRQDMNRRILLVLLDGLDAKRNGAFLSAGLVAHRLLMMATRSGDLGVVDKAADATDRHARLSKVGAYAQMMAVYASGLRHVAKGEFGAACPKLQQALDQAAAEQWSEATMHVATELASSYLRTGQVHKVRAALEKAAQVLKASGDRSIAVIWRELVEARLDGTTEEVLAPYRKAVEPYLRGGTERSGGRDERTPGGPGGGEETKVGAAWKKLSARKPFVTATRTEAGFAIRQAFDRKFEAVQSSEHGIHHLAAGGVTLAFWDRGVALHAVSWRGRGGPPMRFARPMPLSFFHPLARGETWGVDKAGGVTIVGK